MTSELLLLLLTSVSCVLGDLSQMLPMSSRPLRLLYVHGARPKLARIHASRGLAESACDPCCTGLEAGPGGYKVVGLRDQGFDVIAPEMEMSLYDVRQRNALLRNLLSPVSLFTRWPWRWLRGAMDESFSGCIAVQRLAVQEQPQESPFDVLVGSSWGAAVAAALLADGTWSGPAVLLCPALQHKERWALGSLDPSLSTDNITARLVELPATRKASILLVHGTGDNTVPFEDSQALSAATGIPLELIDGGSHGLGSIVRDGRLKEFIDRVHSKARDGKA